MFIHTGSVVVDAAALVTGVVKAETVDGVNYAVLENGNLRVVDVDSLGLIEMRVYREVAPALVALEALVAAAKEAL